MGTEKILYFSYPDAVWLHMILMKHYGEIRYGVADRTLIESALARPQQAAAYEKADLIRQAATLCFGLIKNHPWVGGNKRTATAITQEFLKLDHHRFTVTVEAVIEMVMFVESDYWKVDEIEAWLRPRTIKN